MGKFIRIKKIEENDQSHSIDIKGALTLSFTVILFLMGISYLEQANGGIEDSLLFFGGSAISAIIFVIFEKRAKHPLIDLNLLSHRVLLPTNIVLMTVGISTFMVYQTIPILIQSPKPLGFGGDAISTASVQLPFMIISLIVSAASGFIVSKVGNFKLTALGTIIGTMGFFGLVGFHSTEFMISAALGIISIGLSFAFVGGFNIVLVSSPQKVEGISLGMTVLLILIGQSVGPSLAGMFLQMYSQTIPDVSGIFPSPQSYLLIFFSAGIISLLSVILVLILKNNVKKLAFSNHT